MGLLSIFQPPPGKPKILAVDDDLNVLDLVKEILETGEHQVDIAADALEALPLIKANIYELIILDYNMPKMSGTELLKVIRALPGREKQAVVMLSAEDSVETMEGVFDLGVIWICKPFSPERFIRKVHEHIKAVNKK